MHRIYCPDALAVNQTLTLERDTSKHLVQVLRHTVGDVCHVFNNQGEYKAHITHASVTRAQLFVDELVCKTADMPYQVTIAQGIPQAKKLDFVIQKSSELGAAQVQPLFSEHSMRHYNHARGSKIATASAMQCQRNTPLVVNNAVGLLDWLENVDADVCLLAHHPSLSTQVPMSSMHDVQATAGMKIVWLIGPEGGLSDSELGKVVAKGFYGVQLSTYILRTETVALAALAVTDYWWRCSM